MHWIVKVLSRRNLTTEPALSNVLSNMTRECRKSLTSQLLSALEERDRNEAESLERDLYSKNDTSISLPGRQSGDKEWRMSRSEFGSDSLSSSSCPVRKCVDEHVTNIYNAFFPLMSKFVEQSCSKSEAAELIMLFRKILVELKNSPFKTRRTSINAISLSQQFMKFLPSFSQLLDALSLKTVSEVNGRINISLASEPVKTSIGLPVVFHALDDLIYNVNHCNKLDKSLLSWPLLKLNRICCGLVLASGEELPFGIVSALTCIIFISDCKWELLRNAVQIPSWSNFPNWGLFNFSVYRLPLHLMELGCLNGKNQMVRQVCQSKYIRVYGAMCWSETISKLKSMIKFQKRFCHLLLNMFHYFRLFIINYQMGFTLKQGKQPPNTKALTIAILFIFLFTLLNVLFDNLTSSLAQL